MTAAIKLQERHDWNQLRLACYALLGEALSGIAELIGLPKKFLDDSWYIQVTTAPLLLETNIIKAKARLYDEYSIELPVIEWNSRKLIRVSIQGYNTKRDVDRLLEALSRLP